MANLKMATALRNNILDQITAYAGTSAVLKIYSGTQPAGGGTQGTILAQLTCNASQFAPAASAGTLTLSSISQDAAANNSGTATWFRVETSVGGWVLDGDVSTSAAGTGDLQLNDTSIVQNGVVALGGPNIIVAPNAA
jgi:hypothetical protein